MFNIKTRTWRPRHASSEEAFRFSEVSANIRNLILLIHQKRTRINAEICHSRLHRRKSTIARFAQRWEWDSGLSSLERELSSLRKIKYIKFRPEGFCSLIKQEASKFKAFGENQKLHELDAHVEKKKREDVKLCHELAKKESQEPILPKEVTQTDIAHNSNDRIVDKNREIAKQLMMSFAARCDFISNDADSDKLRCYQRLCAKNSISMEDIEAVANINTHRHTSGCMRFASVFFKWRKTTSIQELQLIKKNYESDSPSI